MVKVIALKLLNTHLVKETLQEHIPLKFISIYLKSGQDFPY